MHAVRTVPLLYHSIRHLRPRQILGQVLERLRRRFGHACRWQARLRIPPLPGTFPPVKLLTLPPGLQSNSAADLLQGRFTFLNHTADLGWPPRWTPVDVDLLWDFNLHYFDWLWALDYGDARDAVLHWISDVPLGRDASGWRSYPLSLRLQNWLGFFFGRHRETTLRDRKLLEPLWRSLFVQSEWLFRHPEYHILGNHLLENAVSLTMAGATLGGMAGTRWQRRGESILRGQLVEQILPDGMHFERAPMYHARCMYILLAAGHTCSEPLRPILRDKLTQMWSALRAVCHPDGHIALFNDSAFGISHAPAQLEKTLGVYLGAAPGGPEFGPFALKKAGYFGYRQRDRTYILCDAGDIGPDYLPAHGHGDMFSFELSLKGHRVVVDAGVYGYAADEMRNYCRSTRAHNTVEIDGRDQCEFWADFLVARRGHVSTVQWEPSPNGFLLRAAHDGYSRLPGAPQHARTFQWTSPGRLRIDDKISAGRPVQAVSRLHLHPHCRILHSNENSATIQYPAGTVTFWIEGSGGLSVEDSIYCPEFGVQHANICLAWRIDSPSMRAHLQMADQ